MDVDLDAISCRFGGTPAVHDISLSVPSGQFLALVGPSGAGKTTLLRIIAGLQPDFTGQLVIGGRDMAHVPARRRNIGFVFQNYALFRHMTVAGNVAFGLSVLPRARRPARAAIDARVRELLELVQVGALEKRYPDQLSGGQRQRVALARALATDPGLLLLDEPFGALDPLVRKEIRRWLRSLHDRLGLTSILVTHDQEEAMEVADRIALLRDGRIEQLGAPADLEGKPANLFVHRFLGETVTFDATVQDGMPRLQGAWGSCRAALPQAEANGPVVLSLRPYEIGFDPHAEGDARILSVYSNGAQLRYRVSPLQTDEAVIELLAPPLLTPLPPGTRGRLDLSRARSFPASVP